MEVINCNDINGNDIGSININDDGTVWGVLDVEGVDTEVKLSYECCTDNGYIFDPTNAKCYWSNTCSTGDEYKIVISPVDERGAFFQIDENDVIDCNLEVEFDYIIKFDCDNLILPLKDAVEALKLVVSLEKTIYDESLPIPNNLESVYSESMFNVPDIATFLSGNTNTGLLLEGENCDPLMQNLINDLGPFDSQTITTSSFNSTWVNHKMIISDPDLLTSISNEYLKIVILGNNATQYSILINNVQLNRVCTETFEDITVIENCPSFELKRVIDNKKSWVSYSGLTNREFDLSRRETNYNIPNDRLGINTKEVDILISPSAAIHNDVFTFTKANPCILSAKTGCTVGTTECVDMTSLMTTPLVEIVDGDDLLNEFIDVKSRKTISKYPTIELLYSRYLNSNEHCGVESNSLDFEAVEQFTNVIGGFWSDLIEQVVPATTIWGSSFQQTSDVFGTDKFKYKKSTLLLCGERRDISPIPVDGPTTNPVIPFSAETESEYPEGKSDFGNVGVTTSDITDTGYFGPPEFEPIPATNSCVEVYISQITDASEFIGTISIIGGDGENTITGSTITLNETITDDCGLIGVVDWDKTNNDWEKVQGDWA